MRLEGAKAASSQENSCELSGVEMPSSVRQVTAPMAVIAGNPGHRAGAGDWTQPSKPTRFGRQRGHARHGPPPAPLSTLDAAVKGRGAAGRACPRMAATACPLEAPHLAALKGSIRLPHAATIAPTQQRRWHAPRRVGVLVGGANAPLSVRALKRRTNRRKVRKQRRTLRTPPRPPGCDRSGAPAAPVRKQRRTVTPAAAEPDRSSRGADAASPASPAQRDRLTPTAAGWPGPPGHPPQKQSGGAPGSQQRVAG